MVESARSQFYDDEDGRRGNQRDAVLNIPITDFELSVRSRNCLKKMTSAAWETCSAPASRSYFRIRILARPRSMRSRRCWPPRACAWARRSKTQDPRTLRKTASVPGNIPTETMAKTVADLELSVRSRKALQRLNINTIGELASRTEAEFARLQKLRPDLAQRDQAATDDVWAGTSETGRLAGVVWWTREISPSNDEV